MSALDDDDISYGDFVEHKCNTNVFGVAIGFEGSLVHVRLSPSLTVAVFHEVELRLLEDDEYHGPEVAAVDGGNVVDFTKAAALRADTKTKGAA